LLYGAVWISCSFLNYRRFTTLKISFVSQRTRLGYLNSTPSTFAKVALTNFVFSHVMSRNYILYHCQPNLFACLKSLHTPFAIQLSTQKRVRLVFISCCLRERKFFCSLSGPGKKFLGEVETMGKVQKRIRRGCGCIMKKRACTIDTKLLLLAKLERMDTPIPRGNSLSCSIKHGLNFEAVTIQCQYILTGSDKFWIKCYTLYFILL
jgi:hypothetical protein